MTETKNFYHISWKKPRERGYLKILEVDTRKIFKMNLPENYCEDVKWLQTHRYKNQWEEFVNFWIHKSRKMN
jgi:hypothetical protein